MAEIKIYSKPLSLFRYRPLGANTDRELDAIESRYIFCPAFSDMNDPMEGAFRPSVMFKESDSGDERQHQIREALGEMGIASLSEVYDHEPMWAHYADQFRGMCIQYNMSRLLNGLSGEVALTRMMYSEKEPVLLKDRSSAIERARLSLSCKTVRWASEREWRIFIDRRGRASYEAEQCVRRIYLGARISPENEARVLEVARRLRIPVSKMNVEAYAISFKLVPRLRSKR